ncbi:nucleotide exchange factor GrpE [Tractidigestivibacter sp.]|uniref:nucleotide exchange factor GrpE n=1 Tax=Tractidigestivibacter sp. TaxID=2847320 RepID=UPI003D92E315
MVAPSSKREEGDVKVPVEDVNDKKDAKTEDSEAKKNEAPAAAQPSAVDDIDPDDDAAMREAAKRAAEEVLQQEAAEDAKKAKNERDELKKQVDDLTDQIEKAKKEASDATERMMRLQADWDNYRRRTAQERLDERERAAEKLVCNLLPVIDDMERAIDHASAVDSKSDQFTQFVSGVSAVHDKMVSILGKEGVEVIDPVGEAFDPLEQQAVGRSEDSEAYEDTVAQVYQKGYRMGGKVIRTAMVTVTYGGPKRPAEKPDAKDDADKKSDKASDAKPEGADATGDSGGDAKSDK